MEESIGQSSRRGLWIALLQGAAIGILLGASFIGGYLYHAHAERSARSNVDFSLLQEADALLANHYLYELPDSQDRIYGAVGGLAASLGDPYTYFVQPESAEVDEDSLAGRFGGIGAEIHLDEQGRFVIVLVYPDTPALEAGVEVGDIILGVDGYDVQANKPSANELLAMIRGEVGDPVTLRLQRGDEVLEIEIVRAELLIPSVFWRVLEEDSRVGYVQIMRFTDRTPREVQDALADLDRNHVEALVLDLRDNGGGLVDSVVEVASEFISGGPILYEVRRGEEEQVFNASRGGLALETPLVVLINGGTASASEILAGAFQDRERATLVGEPTFGKGSVQLILSMSDGSSLHVTTAEWYTPNHHRIQAHGLTPDVAVSPQEGQDAALRAALEILGTSLARVAVN